MLWTGKWQAVRALHGIDPSTTDPRLLRLGYFDTHTHTRLSLKSFNGQHTLGGLVLL